MNDPGVDEPVRDAAEDLDRNPYLHEEKLEEEEEQDYLDPRHANPHLNYETSFY
jgi:potassium channel subfamily K